MNKLAIPCNPQNYGGLRTQKVRYIVIHYTAGDGDTARNNGLYFQRNAVGASAHWFVDEKHVLLSVPEEFVAWHCGGNVYVHPECRNGNSIGVELCSDKDKDGVYYFTEETVERAVELVRELIRRLNEKRVSISLPSLRLDSILKDALTETQKERKTSLTFAPEAGTQRLRDVINKGVTEEDLIEKVRDAFEGGWSSVKLYFMMGLPTETYEDLDGIADLADKVVKQYFAVPKAQRAKGLRVTCSASVFVPKPFTPFQWEPQDTQEVVKAKQQHMRDKFKAIKGANFNYHESDLSYLEACFARGDRKMGKVLLRAFEKGCMLDGWSEHFKYDAWREAFQETGIDPAFYAFRRREKDEIMPWDHIDCGVTKEFLWREKEKADQAATTKDCRKGCNGCGLQRFKGVCSFCG